MVNKALLSSVEGIPQQVWFPQSGSRNIYAGLYSKTLVKFTLKISAIKNKYNCNFNRL